MSAYLGHSPSYAFLVLVVLITWSSAFFSKISLLVAVVALHFGLIKANRLISIDRSGCQQKDRKPSQNDKTEHGMEKTMQAQDASRSLKSSA
ncbi:hypothetical protein Tco_0724323 [Tanacetum coccineum]